MTNGRAAGFDAISQLLNPATIVNTMRQVQAHDETKRKNDEFKSAVDDMNFRASQDPALHKRITSVKKQFPNALSSPEEFHRFNSHLTEMQMGEEMISLMSQQGMLGTSGAEEAMRKTLAHNPSAVINDLHNLTLGNVAARNQAAQQQQIKQTQDAEAGIAMTKANQVVEQLITKHGGDERAVIRDIRRSPDIPDHIRLAVADDFLSREAKLDAASRSAATTPEGIAQAEEEVQAEVAAFNEAQGEADPQTQFAAIESADLSDAARKQLTTSLFNKLSIDRTVSTQTNEKVRALTEQLKTLQAGAKEEAKRKEDEDKAFAAEQEKQFNVKGGLNSLLELGIISKEATESLDAFNQEIADKGIDISEEKAFEGRDIKMSDIETYLVQREAQVRSENLASSRTRVQSLGFLNRSGLNRQVDLGQTTVRGRGSSRVTKPRMQDVLVPSNQYNNVGVISNSPAQVATKNNDLDGLGGIQSRFVVGTPTGNYTAVDLGAGGELEGVVGFGVDQETGDVTVVPLVEEIDEATGKPTGNLIESPKGPLLNSSYRDAVTAMMSLQHEDDHKQVMNKSLKSLGNFVNTLPKDDPDVTGFQQELKELKDQHRIDGDLLSSGAVMAKFIKLRQRLDAKLTGAYLSTPTEE